MVYYPYDYYFDTITKVIKKFSINKIKVPKEYVFIGRFFAHEQQPYYDIIHNTICKLRYNKVVIIKDLGLC